MHGVVWDRGRKQLKEENISSAVLALLFFTTTGISAELPAYDHCYGLNVCVSSDSYVEILTPKVIALGGD